MGALGVGGAALFGSPMIGLVRAWAQSTGSVMGEPGGKRVVIIGGGFGGNFVAVTLRKLVPAAEIVIVEKNAFFTSGPASIEYIFGLSPYGEITRPYKGLTDKGIKMVKATVQAVEPDKKRVLTSAGALGFDYLVLTTGIRLAYEEISGLAENMWVSANAYDYGQHGELKRRIEAYDGGTIVMNVPPPPYKCPPGPYEIACLFAERIQAKRLRGRVVLIDPHEVPQPPPVSRGFHDAINFTYSDQITYMTRTRVAAVEPGARAVVTDKGESIRGDLISIIPPNRAAAFIKAAGLGDPFIEVNPATFQSTKFENVYALGDAARTPFTKSAFVASVSGKVCAAALARAMKAGPRKGPEVHNICYPLITSKTAMMVRVDWAVRVEDGRATVSARPASDINPSAGYVATRREWEQGLWREMFGR